MCSADRNIGISLETALLTARQALASVAERAKQGGYYSGARTDIINAHADLRAALDMLVKAAGPGGPRAAEIVEVRDYPPDDSRVPPATQEQGGAPVARD